MSNIFDRLDDISHNDEEYDELCSKAQPSDFYFESFEQETCFEESNLTVDMTPAVYFDKNGYGWDQSLSSPCIPEWLSEAMECSWEVDWDYPEAPRTKEELDAALLALGFRRNPDWSALVNKVRGIDENESPA